MEAFERQKWLGDTTTTVQVQRLHKGSGNESGGSGKRIDHRYQGSNSPLPCIPLLNQLIFILFSPLLAETKEIFHLSDVKFSKMRNIQI